MLPFLTSTSQFLNLTNFLTNLLLLNFSLNPNIQTIVLYHDNQCSYDFIYTLLDSVSKLNQPLVIKDIHHPISPDVIGHQVIYLFLWKNARISRNMHHISTIQDSETVVFIFEDPLNVTDVQKLSRSLWVLYKAFNAILVYQNVERNVTDLVVFRPFKDTFSNVTDISDVIKQRLYGEVFNSKPINMREYNISTLLIARPPYVLTRAGRDKSEENKRFGGRDGKMARFLSRYYNATFNYITKSTTKVLVVQRDGGRNIAKYVPVSAVQDSDIFVVDDAVRPMALNVTADILMNSRMCCDIENDYVPFYPHEFDSYVVLAPSATSYIGLHHIYHPSTFLLGFATIVLFFTILIIFKCILYDKKDLASLEYQIVFLELLGMCLFTKDMKVSKFLSERILITFILFFATVMSIIEAGIIYDAFVKDIKILEINTLKELESSDYPILLTADSKVLMEFGKVSEKLQEKFVLADDNSITYDILSGDTSQAYVLRRSRAESFLQRYSLQKDGYCIFHIVKESLLPSLLSYYARDTFPFADDFNQLVQRSIENGILQHYDDVSKYKLYFKDNHRKDIDSDRKNREKVIELPEIMSTLMIFFVGMGTSCVIFVLELIWARVERSVMKWIEIKRGINLMETIKRQNQGFIKEKLFEFVE